MKRIEQVKSAGIILTGVAVLMAGMTGCSKKPDAQPAPAAAEQPAKAPADAAAPADTAKPKDHPAH